MKKTLIICLLVAVMAACIVVPAFAAEDDPQLWLGGYFGSYGEWKVGEITDYLVIPLHEDLGEVAAWGGFDVYYIENEGSDVFSIFYCTTDDVCGSDSYLLPYDDAVLSFSPDGSTGTFDCVAWNSWEKVPSTVYCMSESWIESNSAVSDSLYYQAYEMFRGFIYGDGDISSDQSLTLTIISTLAVLFVVALPFLIVFFVIKFVCGR